MIRDLGHDCLDASAIPPRMPDVDVLRMAADDGRVVVTADKDFGELVFVHQIACPGVVLVRVGLEDETDRVSGRYVLRSCHACRGRSLRSQLPGFEQGRSRDRRGPARGSHGPRLR
jgi:hypothetical protein